MGNDSICQHPLRHLGSAGGVRGCIKLLGGLSLWDANAWRDGFLGDAQLLEADGTAFNGV